MIEKLCMEARVKQAFIDCGFEIEANKSRLTFSIKISGGIEDGDILYYMIDNLHESKYMDSFVGINPRSKPLYTLTFTMSGRTPSGKRKNYLYINTTQDIKLNDDLSSLINHFYSRKILTSTIKANIRENNLNKLLEQ